MSQQPQRDRDRISLTLQSKHRLLNTISCNSCRDREPMTCSFHIKHRCEVGLRHLKVRKLSTAYKVHTVDCLVLWQPVSFCNPRKPVTKARGLLSPSYGWWAGLALMGHKLYNTLHLTLPGLLTADLPQHPSFVLTKAMLKALDHMQEPCGFPRPPSHASINQIF